VDVLTKALEIDESSDEQVITRIPGYKIAGTSSEHLAEPDLYACARL